MHLDGTSEIVEAFDDAIEAIDFIVENAHRSRDTVLSAGRLSFRFSSQEPHRVKWILHFVRDARGNPSNCGEAFGYFKFAAEIFTRFEIAKRNECAPIVGRVRFVFRHGLHGNAYSARAARSRSFGDLEIGVINWLQAIAFETKCVAQRMSGRKYFGGAAAEKLICRRAEKFFYGRTNEYGTAILREKNRAVFESAHDLIHVFAQRAEDFAHPAQLLAEASNFRTDLAEFISGGFISFGRRRIEMAGGITVELPIDRSERGKHGAADDADEQCRQQHSTQCEQARGTKAGNNLSSQKSRLNRDAYFAIRLRLFAETQRKQSALCIKLRSTEDDAELFINTAAREIGEWRVQRKLPRDHRRITQHKRAAVAVGDADFIDGGIVGEHCVHSEERPWLSSRPR